MPEFNQWLLTQYAQTKTGLNIAAREEDIHSRDIKISTKDLIQSENPDLIKLGKALDKNNQTLAIDHHYFDDAPFAPMTPEKLKERLKNPKSVEYKNMMAALFQFIIMLLSQESYLLSLDDLFYRRRLYREFLDNRRDYGRAAWDDDFPIHKRPEIYSHPISITVNFELLRCQVSSQAAQDYLFLSQFCPAGKEYVVQESIARRTQRRMDFVDHLENTLNGKPPPKPHVVSLVEEQAAVFARNLELGAAITQNRILGDVIEKLMSPSVSNSMVAAKIEEITQKFEVAEQAFVEVNQRALDRAVKESKEPELFAQKQVLYEEFSLLASKLNVKVGKVISDFYDEMGRKLDNVGPGYEGRYLLMMDDIREKEAALLDLKMALSRVANTDVKITKEFVSEVQNMIQEIKSSTEDKEIAHDLMHMVKENCGDQLDKLEQMMLKAYVSQLRAETVVGNEVEQKVKTEVKPLPYMHLPKVNSMLFKKEEQNNSSFTNKFKDKLVETVKNTPEPKEEPELRRVSESDREDLDNCVEKLNSFVDDEATKLASVIKELKEANDGIQVKGCLDEIKKIIDKLPSSETDDDTQKQICEAIYRVRLFSELVIEAPLQSFFNKSN